MPLDADLKALLDKAAGLPKLETLSVSEARRLHEARARPPAAEVGRVDERSIDGPGGSLRLRIYTPADGRAPRPLLVFCHGSGFVLCSLDTHDGMCRNLCAGSGYVVVSVDYRLAPEAKFPAGSDDCLAATRWAAANAAALGAIPGFVVVGGDSAGGNMAAVTALRCRDEGGPPLAGQVLIYPVTDHYSVEYASYAENAEGYGLGRLGMQWFWDHYLGTPEQASDPLASPMRAPDLAGLPPALVLTAEFDPLRDEGEAYGARLAAAGVACRTVRLDGVNHGFLALTGWVAKADVAMAIAVDWLKALVPA